MFDIRSEVEISAAGVQRLHRGHLWIYASDVTADPGISAPIVRIRDSARNPLGFAFYSPKSQIRLRFLSREVPDRDFFRERLRAAIERRRALRQPGSACRLVFGEADLLPSVVIDRYADFVVMQTLSFGADAIKGVLVDALVELLNPSGILERNDVKARSLEGLPETSGILRGHLPEQVRISEGGISFWVDLLHGQKTGFFLDQTDNRIAAAAYARGRGLDCFTNTGGFALHFARQCTSVVGVDASAPSLIQARRNAELNGLENVAFLEGNAFDYLREREKAGDRYETLCLDPPAFAKNRAALPSARGGYKEINLRAMKLLAPEGILVTSSCSYHLSEEDFLSLLLQAARDAHRQVQLLERRAQSTDHPILMGMPETHYLKCAVLRVL